jgi:hypothetical protein
MRAAKGFSAAERNIERDEGIYAASKKREPQVAIVNVKKGCYNKHSSKKPQPFTLFIGHRAT